MFPLESTQAHPHNMLYHNVSLNMHDGRPVTGRSAIRGCMPCNKFNQEYQLKNGIGYAIYISDYDIIITSRNYYSGQSQLHLSS